MIVGVDYDTYRVVLAAVPFEDDSDGETVVEVETISYRKTSGFEAKADFQFEAAKRIGGLLLGSEILHRIREGVPAVVWIERGFGMSRRSDYLLGRIQGLVLAAVQAAIPPGSASAVNEITIQEWKREIVGNGNAKKEAVVPALLDRWSVLLVEPGFGETEAVAATGTPDEWDAAAIALAGRLLNARASA